MLPTLILFLLFMAAAAASFLPEQRLWGINHLAYYSLPVRIVALSVIGVTFIPIVSRSIFGWLAACHGFFQKRRRAAMFAGVAAGVAGFFVFSAFQSSTLLLGDGEVVVNELNATYHGDSTAVGRALVLINRSEPISRGTTTIQYLSSVVQSRLFGVSPPDSIRFLSCALGGLFVWLILFVAFRITNAVVAVWLVLLALASGAMQLFFGYVENYTLLFVIGALYVITGVRVAGGSSRVWIPAVLFILAVYSHVSGILLGASLAFLIARSMVSARVLRALVPVFVILACVVALVAKHFTFLGEYFLPAFSSESTYGVLSWNHRLDIANELLLLLPVMPLIVVGAIRVSRRRRTLGSVTAGDVLLARRDEWRFAFLLLFPLLIYLVFFNPEIGMARDWDLFTPVLFGLVPVGLLMLNRLMAGGWTPHSTTVPAAAITLVLVGAWVGINASPERSTARFEHILGYQEKRADYAYEVLAKTYSQQGRLADAIRIQETVTAFSANPRHHLTLAKYYLAIGDTEAYFQTLVRTNEAHPSYDGARKQLLMALFNRGRFDDVVSTARKGLEYRANDAFYHFFIGRGLVRTGRIEEGRAELLAAQRWAQNPAQRRAIDEELDRLDR